jgi:adenylate cyclase
VAEEPTGAELAKRIGWSSGARIGLANFAGAVFALVSGNLANANASRRSHLFSGVDLVVFATFLALSMLLCGLWCKFSLERALRWLGEERRPTADEQRLLLTEPMRQALQGMLPWLVAAVLWGLLNGIAYDNGLTYSVRVSLAIVLGGMATCALTFLLTERALRPAFALALAGEVPARSGALGVRPRLMLSWALGADIFLVMIGLTFFGRPADRPPSALAIWFLVDSGLVTGTLVLYVAARSLADPLRDLRQAIGRVQHGDLSVEVGVDDGGEVGLLQAGFNHMVAGLRERRQLQDLFGRHVGADVARLALEQGAALGGERRQVSVLFVDLVGSTELSQTRPPEEVVGTLNAFFDAVVRTVGAEGGWVNKFEGDGALCVFGAPVAQADHAARSLRAARTLRQELLALGASYPGFDAAIGVSAGDVVAGNVGTEDRYEYTVIGDPVNEAARLTEQAKQRLGRVLASEEAVARSGNERRWWMVGDEIPLRGRLRPTLAYEPAPEITGVSEPSQN